MHAKNLSHDDSDSKNNDLTSPKWPPRLVARVNNEVCRGTNRTVPRTTEKQGLRELLTKSLGGTSTSQISCSVRLPDGRSRFSRFCSFFSRENGLILTCSRTINGKMTSLVRSQQQKRCSLYPYHTTHDHRCTPTMCRTFTRSDHGEMRAHTYTYTR